jgi:hypothetical protein
VIYDDERLELFSSCLLLRSSWWPSLRFAAEARVLGS